LCILKVVVAVALEKNGVTTQAGVIRTYTGQSKAGRQYWVEYRFEIDGELFKGEGTVPAAVWDKAKRAGKTDVAYLRSIPNFSEPAPVQPAIYFLVGMSCIGLMMLAFAFHAALAFFLFHRWPWGGGHSAERGSVQDNQT
jgi:hypothetical protein